MLRDRFFLILTDLASSRRRGLIYLCAGVLTLASILLLPQLEILTTRQGMIREDLPVQADFTAYMNEFGSPTQLVLMLEGDPLRIRAAADGAARALLQESGWVRNVFYRIDVETFRRAGLYYLGTDELREIRDFLEADKARTQTLMADRDLAGLLKLLEGVTGGASLDSLSHPAFGLAESLLERWRVLLAGEDGPVVNVRADLESLYANRQGAFDWIDPQGYLLSDDGRAAYLFIQQAEKTDATSFILPFMERMRAVVGRVLKEHPGVGAGFTGWPAAIAEDHSLLISDLPRVSGIATVIILLLFVLAFRSLRRTVLVFVPLVCGLIWNLGFVVLTIGHLNYLSSVFVGILFGLGIDFGIYFVRRFDEERLLGADPRQAIHRTFCTAGQGIITGGLTAVVAFFAIGFTDQPAFSELGIVAGAGVGSVLLATLLLLPPLLVQFRPSMKGVKSEVVSAPLERSARLVLLRPRTVLAAALVLLAVCVWYAPRIQFDYDLNNLLPADSEAMRVLREMEKGSPFSDQFVAVIADSLEEVRLIHAGLEERETVHHVESLAPAVPSEPGEKRGILGETLALLPKAADQRESSQQRSNESANPRDQNRGGHNSSHSSPGRPAASGFPDQMRLAGPLDRIIERMNIAEEDAFAAGLTDAMETVGRLRDTMESIRASLSAPEAGERQASFENEVFGERDLLRADFEEMLGAEPITLDTLEAGVRDRLLGSTGRMAVLAFPSEPIWDPHDLILFVNDVRGVAEEVFGPGYESGRVTGFAVTYAVTAPMIRDGFRNSTWAAGIVVVLMLLIDLRRPKPLLLALIPLVATAVALLGGMVFFGVKLTMATQVTFPILFGLGVAYGVHMVHRLREPHCSDPAHAVGTTGKAIGLAAATTMAGFGALMLARHTALIAFGTTLFLGILIATLSALYLIPVVAAALKMDLRR